MERARARGARSRIRSVARSLGGALRETDLVVVDARALPDARPTRTLPAPSSRLDGEALRLALRGRHRRGRRFGSARWRPRRCARAKRSTDACFAREIGLSVPNPRREAFRILRRVEDAGAFASVLLEGSAAEAARSAGGGAADGDRARRAAPPRALDHAIIARRRRGPLDDRRPRGAHGASHRGVRAPVPRSRSRLRRRRHGGRPRRRRRDCAKAAGFVERRLADARARACRDCFRLRPSTGTSRRSRSSARIPPGGRGVIVDRFGWDRAGRSCSRRTTSPPRPCSPRGPRGSSSTLAQASRGRRGRGRGVPVRPRRAARRLRRSPAHGGCSATGRSGFRTKRPSSRFRSSATRWGRGCSMRARRPAERRSPSPRARAEAGSSSPPTATRSALTRSTQNVERASSRRTSSRSPGRHVEAGADVAPLRRGARGRAVQRNRNAPPPPGDPLAPDARRISRASPTRQRRILGAAADLVRAGRAAGLLGLLDRARGGRT